MRIKSLLQIFLSLALVFTAGAYAAEGQTGLAGAADNLTVAVVGFVKLVLSIAEIAGFAFGIAGIMKFKQHRENPAQVTLSQPITLFLIGVALIWLPTLMGGGGVVSGGKNITECFDNSTGQFNKDCLNSIGGSSGS